MADTAAFIATLGLKLEGFEQELKRANALATNQLDAMERGFSTRNLAIGTGLGNIFARAIEHGVRDGILAIREFNEQLLDMGRISRFSGVALNEVFALGEVLGGLKEAKSAVETIATQFEKLQSGGKAKDVPLVDLFNRNNIKNVADTADAIDRVLRLINSIGSEVDAREAGKKLGFSPEAVDRIRQAGNNLDAMRAVARDAAPDLAKLQRQAELFDEAWTKATQSVKAGIINAFGEGGALRTEMQRFLRDAITIARALESVGESVRSLFGITGKTGLLGQAADKMQGVLTELNKPVSTAANAARGTGTAKGLTDTFKLSDLDKEARRATERTQQMALEAQLLGATTEERARATEELRLQQQLLRDGGVLTEQQQKKIQAIADQYGLATAQLEKMRLVQQKIVELQNFAGNLLVDALDKAAAGGAKFADILKDIAAALRRAALQALILGQGPLAGVFGTQNLTGSGSAGGLFSLLPRFQSGGVVPGSGPVPIIAHGGETIIPPRSVISGGSKVDFKVNNYGAAVGDPQISRGADGATIIRLAVGAAVDEVSGQIADKRGAVGSALRGAHGLQPIMRRR